MFFFLTFFNLKKIPNMYNEYNLRLGYKSVTDKTFVPLCQGVIQSLTDNPNFPDVGTLLAELSTAVDDYIVNIPAKPERNQINVAIKDAKREIVKSLMRKIGFYVQMVANDDLEKLKSSGFPPAKKPGTNPSNLPMPVILNMTTNGTPRQLMVQCQATAAAKLYDVRISYDQTNWITTTDSKSKVTVQDLTPEVVVYVQARMRNTNHTTPWSASLQTRVFDSAVALSTSN